MIILGFLSLIYDLRFLSDFLEILQNLVFEPLWNLSVLFQGKQGALIALYLGGEADVLVVDLLAKTREHRRGVCVPHDLIELFLQRLLSCHLFIPV